MFYVWFDAPIEYIGATKEWADQQAGSRDFREWWLEANDVRYVQFMAKDNIPFHTITFPATLIGTGEPWKRVDYIKGFHWLNFYGKKFSTSQNQGIFADQALEDFPADYWRYWLLAHAPETDDSTFTFELFRATVNSDLVDRFGNFVSRCLKLCRARFGESVPTGGQQTESEVALSQILDTHVQEYNKHLSSLQFRRSVETLRMMWDAANSYVTNMAPWSEVTANRSRGACILRTAINMVRIFAKLADPLLPYTASTLRQVLNLTDCQDKWPESITPGDLETLQGGHPFTVPENLFHRITEAQVEILAHKYGAPRKNA